ncbi:prevent-host-death family protein [Streptomyces sp. NPDC006393]|uniref:prevent-host-death family protein n=1 Tax=Streptomyces sp. NPDC006393 TaxID=3156763 RepID=UPI0033D669B2
MTEPVIESVAGLRGHPADVMDRARRESTLTSTAETDEEAWLDRLADEAESEGPAGSVSLEEMSALLQDGHQG